MTDPYLSLGRLFGLIFVPALLLFPVVFLLFVPDRTTSDSARQAARARFVTLVRCTLLALALWTGLLLVGLRVPWAWTLAGFAWFLFFPLWFLVAMPALAARNPRLGASSGTGAAAGTGTPGASGFADAGPVRTASLVNRERESPIARSLWAVPVLVFLLALGAIAARGLAPFPMNSHGAEDAAFAAVERWRWLLTLGVYGSVFGLSLAILPRSLRRTLSEPEPMDARGSTELAELYRTQRRRRVLGLFWGAGVLLPGFLGAVLALPTWYPDAGSLWGLVGGIGGAALGIGGAAFGTWMSVERMRIQEARVKLDVSRAVDG